MALLAPEATEPVTSKVRNDIAAVARLRRKLEKVAPGPVTCCCEAGPCGYALQRRLTHGRVGCEVIRRRWRHASRASGMPSSLARHRA